MIEQYEVTAEEEQEVINAFHQLLDAIPPLNIEGFAYLTVYALLEKAYELAGNDDFFIEAAHEVCLFYGNESEDDANERILQLCLTGK